MITQIIITNSFFPAVGIKACYHNVENSVYEYMNITVFCITMNGVYSSVVKECWAKLVIIII